MDGATLSNAIIGPNNGEGVHCLGTFPPLLRITSTYPGYLFPQVPAPSTTSGGPMSAKTRPPSSKAPAPRMSTAAVPATPTTKSCSTMVAALSPCGTFTPRTWGRCIGLVGTAASRLRGGARLMGSGSRMRACLRASMGIWEVCAFVFFWFHPSRASSV